MNHLPPETSDRYHSTNEENTVSSFKTVTQIVKVKVDTTKVIRTVEETYLSYALDSSLLTTSPHFPGFNFTSSKLITLMRALSPAIFRLGGSGSSYSFFDATQRAFDAARLDPSPLFLQKDDIVKLITLANSVKARLLLDLNIQLRYGEQWDPTNAIRLMDFCAAKGYEKNIDFELGNEPVYPAKGF